MDTDRVEQQQPKMVLQEPLVRSSELLGSSGPKAALLASAEPSKVTVGVCWAVCVAAENGISSILLILMAYITIGILAKFAYAIQYAAVGLDWFMGIVPFVASCTVTAWLVETLCNMVAALPLVGYLFPAAIPALVSTAAPAVAAPIYTCKFITAAIAAIGSVITCCKKG